eukprot:14292597-Ditylum_brightwellii.AAC.2
MKSVTQLFDSCNMSPHYTVRRNLRTISYIIIIMYCTFGTYASGNDRPTYIGNKASLQNAAASLAVTRGKVERGYNHNEKIKGIFDFDIKRTRIT